MNEDIVVKWNPVKRRHEHHIDQQFGCMSYSQHGEDLMLLNLFSMIMPHYPAERLNGYYFLDIGAHDPKIISNTYLLYQKGLTGVNVDANKKHIDAFRDQRPADKNIRCGVVPIDRIPLSGFARFYKFSDTSGRNTLSENEAEAFGRMSGFVVKDVEIIPVRTIDQIITEFCKGIWPMLLSIDIEGYDYLVLKDIRFKPDNRPAIIIAEVRPEATESFGSLMGSKDYGFHCRMGENIIFVDQNYIGLTRVGSVI
jgi:hypothetical protein